MDRPGSGIRRLTGFLLMLNLGVMAGGLAMTHWPARQDVALEFNGEKVKLLGSPKIDRQAHRELPPPDASPADSQAASPSAEPSPPRPSPQAGRE